MKNPMYSSLGLFFMLMSLSFSFGQARSIHGYVYDKNQQPLVGVSVQIQNTQTGTNTDINGEFSIPINTEKRLVLVFTSIGYLKKEISVSVDSGSVVEVNVNLEEEVKILDEMIVTGVFDSRKRIESSIAITTIDSKILDRIVPNSAVELLRQVPGVFTNTSRGEIFNEVVTRGMALGGAYYYVSMQEDGLPIIPAGGQYNPDPFLRADVTLGRIEAVRGGTASVLGVNAPGGIFNYISKTGGSTFEGEFRTRVGLEGNVKNPYYRQDAGFGGPLSKDKSLTYYIGGHYRHADGAKYPGYPLSRGGQIKANLVKKYKQGSIQFNLKYLHDRTVQFEFTPTVNFDKPTPAGNFTNSSSVLNPAVALYYPASVNSLTDISYNSKNLNLYKELAPSLNWEHRLGKGWKIQNALRYSDKSIVSNSSFIVYPFAVDQLPFYAINELLGKFGTYNFYNPKTNQQYGSVTQELDFSNPNFPFAFKSNLNLPGSTVQPNSVFYNPISYENGTMKDLINQFTLKKQYKTMGFTVGVFHSSTWFKYNLTPPAATGYGTIEDKPQFVGIDYIPSGIANPPTYHVTDRNGISGYGSAGILRTESTINQTAFFFGHNWNISDKLNLDWGFRYEDFKLKAKQRRPISASQSLGGVDGDSTTLYDNKSTVLGQNIEYTNHLNTFSFSAGINYKVNNNLSFYGRYSKGSKAPSFNFYNENSKILAVVPQKNIQIEFGVKISKGKSNLFITPFYSALDKILNQQVVQEFVQVATYYATPKIYNKTHTIGVEIEGNYALNDHWSIRANAVVQQFTADKYQYYDTRNLGPADDTLIDRSGKKISSYTPALIINVTPTYRNNKLFVNLNWYYLAKRAANTSETFYLPAFSQFDLNIGYAISPKIQLQASINNVLNKFGIMNWSAPTPSGVPFQTFDTELFTPATRTANPKAVYFTSAIQPRALFISCTFKL